MKTECPIESDDRQYRMGNIDAINAYVHSSYFGEYLTGRAYIAQRTIRLTDTAVIQSGQRYLYLLLRSTSGASAIADLKNCAHHLEHHPEVSWLLGETWLGSVANGRMLQKMGIKIAPENPYTGYSTKINILINALYRRKKVSRRYLRRVLSSHSDLVYASREEFLRHHLGEAGLSSS